MHSIPSSSDLKIYLIKPLMIQFGKRAGWSGAQYPKIEQLW